MKNVFTIFLALVLLPFSLAATEVTLSGAIFFSELDEPIGDYPLFYNLVGAVPLQEGEVYTDAAGEYEITLDIDSDVCFRPARARRADRPGHARPCNRRPLP